MTTKGSPHEIFLSFKRSNLNNDFTITYARAFDRVFSLSGIMAFKEEDGTSYILENKYSHRLTESLGIGSIFLLDDFHKDSYFSIVNEASGGWEAFNQDKLFAYCTEKITKPLYYGHPFILIGWKNSLKFLKEMGFKTYDDIFDESYDELETWEERTKAVWKEVERVLTLPDEKFYEKFDKVQEKVIYNQKRFFAYDGYVDDFITKLMKIYEST